MPSISRVPHRARALSFHSEPASEDHDEAQRARMYQPHGLVFEMTSAIARVTDEALKAAVPDKIRPVSKRLRHAVDLLQRGECRDIKAAAERIGMARESLSRALRMPHVQVFIARKSRETIALGALRASGRINELVDAGSEHVSLDASKHVLAIEGIKPTADAQVSVSIDIKAGYVVDLTEPPKSVTDAPLTQRVINHE